MRGTLAWCQPGDRLTYVVGLVWFFWSLFIVLAVFHYPFPDGIFDFESRQHIVTAVHSHESRDESSTVTAEQVSVIIPCFNERESIGNTVDALRQQLPSLEIIVVDDGSTDGSDGVVLTRNEVRLLRHDHNRGQGASLVTGMRCATRPYVLWYDADGQHSPDMVIQILQDLAKFDCVIAKRTSESQRNQPRRFGRRILQLTARVITGIQLGDVNSGLRAFRREVISKYLHLIPVRFSASTVTTILMIERGYRVGWVEINVRPRIGKSSLSPIRDGWQAFVLIVHLVQLFHPMRFFFPVSAGLVMGGSIYGIVRALNDGRGIPDLAVLLVLTGVQILFFGFMSEQISALRKERFE